MGYRIFGILLILSLFFIKWLEGVIDVNIKGRDFYVFLSSGESGVFLSVKGLSLKEAKEISIIAIGRGDKSKKQEPWRISYLKHLRKFSFRVENLYITTVNKSSGQVFYTNVKDFYLNRGLISLKDALLWINMRTFELSQLYGQIEDDGTIQISKARLTAPGAEANLSASWDGKNYSLSGVFSLKRDNLEAKGELKLKELDGYLSGSLKADGKAFLKDFKLSGTFSDRALKGELLALGGNFKLSLERENLRIYTDSFELGNLDKKLRGRINLEANLSREGWRVSGFAPSVEVEKLKLSFLRFGGGGRLNPAPEGRVYVQSKELEFDGRVAQRTLSGQWRTFGLEREGLRFWMEGSALFDKSISLRGKGMMEGLKIRDFEVKNASLEFSHIGKKTSFSLSSRDFRALGDFEGQNLSLRIIPKGEVISYREFKALSPSGEINLSFERGKLTSLDGNLELGVLYRDLKAKNLKLELGLMDNKPSFKGEGSLEFFGQEIKRALIRGNVSNEGFILNISSDEVSLSLDALKEGFKLHSRVSLVKEGFSLKGELSGSGKADDMRFSFDGFSQIYGFEFPVKLAGRLSDNGGLIKINGFNARRDLWSLSVDEITLEGPLNRALLRPFSLRASLGGYSLISVSFGESRLRDGAILIKGELSDGANGEVEISLSQRGAYARVDGDIQLSHILGIIRSKTGLAGSGNIRVFGEFKNNRPYLVLSSKDLNLRSRFVGIPMSGSLEFKYDKALDGRLELKGPEGSSAQARFEKDAVSFRLFRVPVVYRDERVKAAVLTWAEGSFKNKKLIAKVSHGGGDIKIEKLGAQKLNAGQVGGIDYEIELSSKEPLRLSLPEGQVYANLSGKVWRGGYELKANFPSGRLRYFGRDFYIQRGSAQIKKDGIELFISLNSTLPDYKLIVDIIGDPRFPKVVLRSEPPSDTREVLARLIGAGSSEESLIAVGLQNIPELSGAVQRLTGLDIKLEASPGISPSGEIGVNLKLKKELGQRGTLEYQASTFKSPKESFAGGELKLKQGISIGGRVYSDNSQEARLRLRKKFDF